MSPNLKVSDGVAAILAVVVMGYYLLVLQSPLMGLLIVAVVVALQLALREDDLEHALVIFVLSAIVLGSLYVGSFPIFLTALVVSGFAYTIYTIKSSRRGGTGE